VQRLRLLREVGPETAARLELVYPETNPTILAATVASSGPRAGDVLLALYQQAARWLPTAVGASNAWAVAPALTSTGRAMLCNDPHLEPSVPSVWFAAHVRVADDFESTGVTFVGQPFPIIGHNRRIAWGYTNSFVDSQDLVVEQFHSAAATRYRTDPGAVERISRLESSLTHHDPLAGDACTWLNLALAALIGWPGWVMSLIVTVLLLALAGVLGWRAYLRVKALGPPEETIASVKEEVAWAKRLIRRG